MGSPVYKMEIGKSKLATLNLKIEGGDVKSPLQRGDEQIALNSTRRFCTLSSSKEQDDV
jgi:hypothetical protein